MCSIPLERALKAEHNHTLWYNMDHQSKRAAEKLETNRNYLLLRQKCRYQYDSNGFSYVYRRMEQHGAIDTNLRHRYQYEFQDGGHTTWNKSEILLTLPKN